MAKAPQVKTLAQRLAEMERPKPKTWLDRLTPEQRRDALEVRDYFRAGRYTISTLAVAKSLIEEMCLTCNPDHISRWLRESP